MKHAATAVLFAALLGGCAQKGGPAAPPPLPAAQEIYGVWVIEQARTAPIIDKSRARLVLGRDGAVSGHDSCNPIKASYSYTPQGDRIKFGPVAAGRMMCVELYGEQSDRILSALELAATARVRQDGLLEIRDADGRGLLRATREVKE